MDDISPNFVPNAVDSMIGQELARLDKTPLAILHFSKTCHLLTDYSYWFLLSTLWVSYSGWSDLALWKRLFKAPRPNRKTSIMKPSEVKAFDELPEDITAYRAHRVGEADWISYTLSLETARRFAKEREVNEVVEYRLKKRDVIALFLRRGEDELIMLRPDRANRMTLHEREKGSQIIADIIEHPNWRDGYDPQIVGVHDGKFILANKNCNKCHGEGKTDGKECDCLTYANAKSVE